MQAYGEILKVGNGYPGSASARPGGAGRTNIWTGAAETPYACMILDLGLEVARGCMAVWSLYLMATFQGKDGKMHRCVISSPAFVQGLLSFLCSVPMIESRTNLSSTKMSE